MTFKPALQTSLHGRRFGLSSSGALMTNEKGTRYAAVMKSTADVVQNSTALLFSQSGVNAQTDVSSTVGSTLTNYGLQTITSGTSTAIATFEIAAPVAGVMKEIHIDTSASEVTLGGTATDVVFKPTAAGAGSTLFLSAINLAGTVVVLRGKSATQYQVIGSTTNITIG